MVKSLDVNHWSVFCFVHLLLGLFVLNTHLVKTPDVSLVSTEDGSEQGNVHPVVTIPGRRGRIEEGQERVTDYQTP